MFLFTYIISTVKILLLLAEIREVSVSTVDEESVKFETTLKRYFTFEGKW